MPHSATRKAKHDSMRADLFQLKSSNAVLRRQQQLRPSDRVSMHRSDNKENALHLRTD